MVIVYNCEQCKFVKRLCNCTFYQRNSNNAIQHGHLLDVKRSFLPVKYGLSDKNFKFLFVWPKK